MIPTAPLGTAHTNHPTRPTSALDDLSFEQPDRELHQRVNERTTYSPPIDPVIPAFWSSSVNANNVY